MASNVAVNAAGDVLVLDREGAWKPAQIAQNPQTGARLYLDGDAWKPVPTPPKPQRTPMQEASRGLGLGVRDAVQGFTALPGMVYDAAAAVTNPITGYLGLGRAAPAQQQISGALDAAGLPKPETGDERIQSRVRQEIAGVPATMLGGAALRAAGAAPTVANSLLAAPVAQVAGAAGSGLAGGVVAEAGGGPLAQVAASIPAGALASAIPGGMAALGRMGAGAIEPFTAAGRDAIAADVLLRSSSNPQTLPARLTAGMDDQTRRLPGSVPTTAQAARDPGLMVLEQGVRANADASRGFPSGAAALRDAEAARNANRLRALTTAAGNVSPEQRGQLIRQVLGNNEAETSRGISAIYQAIDPAGTARFSPQGLLQAIDDQIATRFGPGSGGPPADLVRIRAELAQAAEAGGGLPWSYMQNLRSQAGTLADQASRGATPDARVDAAFTALRSAVDDVADQGVRNGRFQDWQRDLWLTATATRREMGNTFNRDATGANATGSILREAGFGNPAMPDADVARRALRSPADLAQTLRASGAARPVVRQQLQEQFMSDLLERATTTGTIADSAGNVNAALSPAQAQRFVNANRGVAAQLFTPQQRQTLDRLMADFSETATSRTTARASGSDTAQNLSVGNLIARASNGLVDPGSPMGQTLLGLGPVLRVLYASPEASTRAIITQAVVDPKFASLLLARATPTTMARAQSYIDQNFGDRLAAIAQAAGTRAAARGATSAATATEPTPQAPPIQ
jgi:hypothetical protein